MSSFTRLLMEVTTLVYLFGNTAYHIVAYRMFDEQKQQISIFSGDAYRYLFIITNDWNMSDKEIVEFYNKRGASKKLFDVQNNDFNWRAMPHSFLEQNTVYLILMAMANIVFKWLIRMFSNMVDDYV